MKIYIQTDIEGIAGWVFFENTKDKSIENHEHRMRMKRLLTDEVNAAVKASFDAGASYVVINDNHGCAYNILFEELDPRCEIIHGRAASGPHHLTDLDSSFDTMVLIGMHAMAGEKNAVCPHSKWAVNNGAIYLSEASMTAAIAGDKGVPTVFISGDQTITKEVKEKIPKIEIGVVKHSYGPYYARSVMPQKACEIIYRGVKRGIINRKKISPYKIQGRVSLNLLERLNPSIKRKRLKKDVVADTITEAFDKAVAQFPWTNYGLQKIDGFQYPSIGYQGNHGKIEDKRKRTLENQEKK